MVKELIKVYNKSNKDKNLFFKLAYETIGIKKQAFNDGNLKALINTLIWG